MKSWISFLIPNDEYKEKRMLYFLAEGAILLFVFLLLMALANDYLSISSEGILLSAMAIFLLYVSARYIFSGIEYTSVATEQDYKHQLRVILVRTFGFVVIFTALYIILVELPSSGNEWTELLGLLLAVSFFMFLSSYVSLKRSFKKNKELL